MSPKVPGGSRRGGRGFEDAWLDNETSGRRGTKKKPAKSPKAALSDPALANAVVTEVFPNQCRVSLDEGGEEILCTYRRAQLLSPGARGESVRERTPVAVGDRVLAEELDAANGAGVISGVAPRANFLARPAPGREEEFHIVAANVDLLAIVASVVQPNFSPGVVDRYLIASKAAGITPLLCVTKADLAVSEPPCESLWESYGELGYEWLLLSVKSGKGLEELKTRISGKTVVFCGHSGVGKTSLFRSLTGRDIGKVGDVNVQTGKGRHTTTSAVMYRDPASGSSWIDTPGIREFGLVGVTPESLAGYFPEFSSLECSVRECHHLGEPGCQAGGLLRYSSYRRIHDSLLEAQK